MGLDMYLTGKRRLVGWNSTPETEELQRKIAPFIGGLNAETVSFEAAYWRKASAIHRWFVDNAQGGKDDCYENYVSKEQLSELAYLCAEVLKDKDKAAELLPPCSGFFFGSSDIDSYYFEQLRYTLDTIDNLLNNERLEHVEYSYQSSW